MIRVRKEKLEKKGKLEQMVVLVLMVVKDKKEKLAQQDLQINLLLLLVLALDQQVKQVTKIL